MMRDYSRITLYLSLQQHDIIVFFSTVVVARDAISKSDSRYLRVRVSDPANLECCQTGRRAVETIWVVRRKTNEDLIIVHSSDLVTSHKKTEDGMTCGTLSLKSVQLNDSGLYQCIYFTGRVKHVIEGAYLQVYSECLCARSGDRGCNCDEN